MASTPGEPTEPERQPTTPRDPLPAFVDWILGALIAIGGLFALVGGSAIVVFVDREVVAEEVAADAVTVTVGTTELTDAEAVEVADAVVSWTGTGLLVTGIAMLAFAAGYVVLRHRAHRRAGTDGRVSTFATHALLGAVATVALSFVPVSAAFGGAVAGYLERGTSDRAAGAGALAGVLPALPVLVAGAFVIGGLVSGLLAVDLVGTAIVVGAATFLALALLATVSAVLGALGGYLGGRFAERRARER